MAKQEVRVVRSTGQVAVAMNVTRRAVTEWCRQGKLACHVTPGGQYRVEVDEHGWPLSPPEDE